MFSNKWMYLIHIAVVGASGVIASSAGAVGFQTGKSFDADGYTYYAGLGAAVVAADLNGDGRSDFVVAVDNGTAISIMITNKDGSVSVTQKILTGLTFSLDALFPQTPLISVGDFNGDGKPDIAFSLRSDLADNRSWFL